MEQFPVSSARERTLLERMQRLNVREQDLEEAFLHSSGPGGQNINKVATCVCLVHRPTGIAVKCQKTRHQGQNRYWARWELASKIEHLETMKRREERARAEKLKRQNRKRPKALKEFILEKKQLHAKVKKNRRVLRPHKWDHDG